MALQSNLYRTATLGTGESGRCSDGGEVWFDRKPVFQRVQNFFIETNAYCNLIVYTCRYETQSKYINKTEITKKQRPTRRGKDEVS